MGNKETKPAPPKIPEKSNSEKIFEATFEFKMMAKQYKKESVKSEQAHKHSVKKVKDVNNYFNNSFRLSKKTFPKQLKFMLLMQFVLKTKSIDI